LAPPPGVRGEESANIGFGIPHGEGKGRILGKRKVLRSRRANWSLARRFAPALEKLKGNKREKSKKKKEISSPPTASRKRRSQGQRNSGRGKNGQFLKISRIEKRAKKRKLRCKQGWCWSTTLLKLGGEGAKASHAGPVRFD